MGIRGTHGQAVLAMALLVGTQIAGAQVYRWTDAERQVHFSDRAPAEAPEDIREIDVPVAPVAPDPELQLQRERGRRLLEVWSAERRQRGDAEQAARASAQRDEQDCAQLRAYLEETRRARYLVRSDETGQKAPLDDTERTGYEQQLGELLAIHCV